MLGVPQRRAVHLHLQNVYLYSTKIVKRIQGAVNDVRDERQRSSSTVDHTFPCPLSLPCLINSKPTAVCRWLYYAYRQWTCCGQIFTVHRYASTVLAVVMCLSVCLSVRPSICVSHAGIVT